MAEIKQQDERWRELAELLGLPPESSGDTIRESPRTLPTEQAPIAPVAPAPDPKPILAAVEPPLQAPSVPDEPWMEPDVVMEVLEEDADDLRADATETSFEESVATNAVPDSAESEMAEEAAAGNDEEQPRRGRRRRRRGRRRGGHDKGDGQSSDKSESGTDRRAAPARAPKGAAEPAPERASRDRDDRRTSQERHKVRRDEKTVAGGNEVEDRWEEEAPVEELDDVGDTMDVQDDDDDADTLSDWNVPSWQDLIASLYRPDR